MNRMLLNRRRLLQGAVAGSALLASPAYLRRASAKTGGTLNIWTYNGFVPEAFLDQFKADTGIQVNIRLVDDQGKQFNLLAAEAANPTVDILTVAGHRFLQFIDSNLLAPVDTGRLKNWGNINPVFSEGDWATIKDQKWGVPILSGAEVLAYNTDSVSPEEAETWDTIFSDKYAQRNAYLLQDMMSVLMLKNGYDGNMIAYLNDHAEAARIVNEIRDFLIAKKPNVRNYYDGGAEIQQMFVNAEVEVAHAWNGPIASLMNDGFPVAMSIPKEGTYGFVYTLNVANNAPNADNAYLFLDALLASPEIGAEISRSSGFISTYKDAAQHLSEQEKLSTSFPEDQLARIQFFRAEANELKYSLLDPAVEQIKAA